MGDWVYTLPNMNRLWLQAKAPPMAKYRPNSDVLPR